MDAEQKAAEARAEARIKALEKKNDRLEKQRDKEIKQLEKMEERMRKHLERVQNARAAALQKQQEQETASMQETRDYEEAMLEQRLELFKSYTARNQKDLERWMKEVGLSYDDFGEDVKAKGEKWSTYFQKSLSAHIRQAGTEVMNDNIWENVGKGIAAKLLKGLGFNNLADFRNFVRTGTMGGGKKGNNDTETHHTGGVVGGGSGSRGNIPNTYKGLHRSEQMVRAQKGEYIINRKSSQRHAAILEAINNGTFNPSKGVYGGLADMGAGFSAGFGGPGAMLAAASAAMFAKGVAQAFNNNYAVGLKKQKSLMGGLFSGSAGTYAGLTLGPEQMKNAAIIATVGSQMGMSTRDLEIGIMTAIAESTLRNLNYGDRDSLGLFQQRPSAGWGTPAQVTNPRYAASKFFSALRGVDGRNSMAPWLAAQAVQRSAFSDGSNYQRWWAAAQAIFTRGLTRSKGGYNATGGGFVMGPGGRHWPTTRASYGSIHDQYTGFPAVDIRVNKQPAYAVADGVITRSEDLVGNDGRVSNGGYYSYGRVIQLKTDAGPEVLYAHLSRRSVGRGQRVKGGSRIGTTGNTGHSFGPHLHFGATNGPLAWLRAGGTIKYDNTPAVLHRGESVLTSALTKRFQDNVSGGAGGDTYDMTFDFRGATIREDVDIEKAVDKALAKRDARVGRKRVVN
jgi:murein DD-endopeptidase MepM/ murein hydrolase activator NlpD